MTATRPWTTAAMGSRKRLRGFLFSVGRARALLIPSVLLLLLLTTALALLLVYSFFSYQQGGGMRPILTLENYSRLLQGKVYHKVILTTLYFGVTVTCLGLVLGYPLAYYLTTLSPKLRAAGLLLLVVPLWTSVVVRSYGWVMLLNRNGVVNSLLQEMGFGANLLDVFPGFWATVLALLQITLPLMVLPIYTRLMGIDPALLESSRILGAGPIRTFMRITLPLSIPGMFAGAVLTLILVLSAYATPALLSPQELVLPVVIEEQISVLFNIPFAATLALVMLALMSVILAIFRRFARMDELFGNS